VTIHLIRHKYDESSGGLTWCNEEFARAGRDAFNTPALATCEPCLAGAAEYGAQVAARLVAIRQAAAREDPLA
jgi:hypothetical protein